ncbi:hypothetical protein AB0D16_26520 [Streptomyces sp. NPDC048161]|uniref:hypothetical protein n=1 Tax=Streptomyces sp. NPDC048161 TaxID=3160985 RepID=UPI0033E06295
MWITVPLALATAGALGWGIFAYAYDYFAMAAADQKPPKPVDINDVLKATVTALTLIGAVLAALYAYRKQMLSEGDAHRADASQLADRYTAAAEQLGHDQAAVRLAGVYALARLADDWKEQRQVCIDVLCAYLRIPYEPDPTALGYRVGEREVRHTINLVIRDHLQQPDSPTAWCTYHFNFSGIAFDRFDLDLSNCHFQGVLGFGDATFRDGVVNLRNATFSGGMTTFFRTEFSGGTVDFTYSTFSGSRVFFTRSTFSGGSVLFENAEFRGGTVLFENAEFRGGTVDFTRAALQGGTVTFESPTFGGTVFGWGPLPIPAGA